MTRANGRAGGTGFGTQLHHLWRTRPLRLPRQSPIAGVAAGFGRRYDVDPVLVRIVFVVATLFGGTGLVLYLLAWLLFPATGDQVSAAESLFGRGTSSQSPAKTVVLVVAVVIAIATVGPAGTGLGGSGLIGLALMLAGWWLLYLRQTEPPTDGYDQPGQPYPDGGLAATGYPDTPFPGGSPWAGPTYGPYTRLPDHYEPDIANGLPDTPPNDAAAQQISPQISEYAATEEIPRQYPAHASDPGNAPAAPGGPSDSGSTVEDSAAGTEDSAVDTTTPTRPDDTDTEDATSAEDVTGTPETTDDTHPPDTAEPSGTARSSGTDPSSDTAGTRTRTTPHPTPPGWDPLGAPPMSWSLPGPAVSEPVAPPAPPPRRPRSRLTAVVIGLAVLAAAVTGALAAAGVAWVTPARIGAAALAVVGLGLIAGAFLRRGYGLMMMLAPLAGFVILASMAGPPPFGPDTMGQHTWTPTTVAELNSDYRVHMGSGTLDLRNLVLTEDRTVNVSVHMGHGLVQVPDSMRAQFNCTNDMGNVQCPPGITGPAAGPLLTVDMDVHAGHAEVQRG